MLCYNFGVDCFQHGHHEVATKLLQYSFELGKNSKGEVTGEIQVNVTNQHQSPLTNLNTNLRILIDKLLPPMQYLIRL